MPRRKRRTRRVQYEPHLVLAKVLNSDFLRTLVYIVYTAKLSQPAGAIAKEASKLLGKSYDHAYVSSYLRRLEKWGVVRPFKDPNNGRLLWWRADSRAAEMVAEEISKQEMKRILETVEEW